MVLMMRPNERQYQAVELLIHNPIVFAAGEEDTTFCCEGGGCSSEAELTLRAADAFGGEGTWEAEDSGNESVS